MRREYPERVLTDEEMHDGHSKGTIVYQLVFFPQHVLRQK